MATAVISHRRARRKRASAWGWASRRFGALVVTIMALATATWFAPLFSPAPPPRPAPAVRVDMAVLPPAQPDLIEVDVAADLAGPLARPARRARQLNAPDNVTSRTQSDGYEVLSAAELDAISQARN